MESEILEAIKNLNADYMRGAVGIILAIGLLCIVNVAGWGKK